MMTVEKSRPFILDCTIKGERKSDMIIPAHSSAPVMLSGKRWMICYATLDANGWDGVHSIIYQIRKDDIDGEIIKEAPLITASSGISMDGTDLKFRRIYGMPHIFGNAKDVAIAGKIPSHHNVFAVKWYSMCLPEKNGKLLPRSQYPADSITINNSIRIMWMQFKLNDAENDIEILQKPEFLRQTGCDGNTFCSISEAEFMNHAMTAPLPYDKFHSSWLEFCTFAHADICPALHHGRIAAVKYEWNAKTRLYEWIQTGPLSCHPDTAIGESSLCRHGDKWIICARRFNGTGGCVWFEREDPFEKTFIPVKIMDICYSPCSSYVCADKKLRIFYSDTSKKNRNPLLCGEILPERNFEIKNVETVFNAETLGFTSPFVDMAKLSPEHEVRQVLIYRVIDKCMTTDLPLNISLENAGLYCSDLIKG